MSKSLKVIKQQVDALIKKSDEITQLAMRLQKDQSIRQELLSAYQEWYRTSRELLRRNSFSGLPEFDQAYGGPGDNFDFYINHYDGSTGVYDPKYNQHFEIPFRNQVALLGSLPSEIESRSHSLLSHLSSEISMDELEQARTLLSNGFVRGAGAIARVALERHIKTIYTTTTGKSAIPKFDQCIIELTKSGVFEERQRKQLAAVYSIGSDCAHAGKAVKANEVDQLIKQVKTIVSLWK